MRRIPKPAGGIGPWGRGASVPPAIGPSDAAPGLALPEADASHGRGGGKGLGRPETHRRGRKGGGITRSAYRALVANFIACKSMH